MNSLITREQVSRRTVHRAAVVGPMPVWGKEKRAGRGCESLSACLCVHQIRGRLKRAKRVLWATLHRGERKEHGQHAGQACAESNEVEAQGGRLVSAHIQLSQLLSGSGLSAATVGTHRTDISQGAWRQGQLQALVDVDFSKTELHSNRA